MTSGNSNLEQAPSASHILTHLVEGFIIQEGNNPFPVERPSFSVDCLRRRRANMKTDTYPLKELKLQQESMLTCEFCGRVDFASVFKRSKRFCSTVCAKRYSVGYSKRVGLFVNRKATIENMKNQRALNESPKSSKKGAPASCHSPQPAQGESSQCADLPFPGATSPPKSPHVSPARYHHSGFSLLPPDPGLWNVEQVYDFIYSLPGCVDIAEEFRSQEIDGQALLLLKEDHLMGTMNIKLGPALKIFAQIRQLKDY